MRPSGKRMARTMGRGNAKVITHTVTARQRARTPALLSRGIHAAGKGAQMGDTATGKLRFTWGLCGFGWGEDWVLTD